MIQRNGRLDPVSWDEALDHVAARLGELITANKSIGVLGSARATNEENYLAGRFARVCLRTNNVDFSYHAICGPLLRGVEEVTGRRLSPLCLNDIASCEVIVLIEGDLAETHPRAASSVLKAVERGAHLITIGHRKTQMARVAFLHLQETPGNEGEIVDGILAAIVNLGLRESTSAAIADDELQQYVKGIETKLDVCRVAESIAHAERAAFLIAPSSADPDRLREEAAAFAMLAALSGHLQKPGSGLLPLVAQSNARGACDMGVVPDRLPGYERCDDTEARQRVEDLWGRQLPLPQGLCAENIVQSVSGMVVLADDPPSIMPSEGTARSALEAMEFLVVLDAFATPTTRLAHVILPIASFAETQGTYTSMEGRVQRLREITKPPGQARNGWQVLSQLCARFDASCRYSSASDVLHEIGRMVSLYAGIEQRLSENGWGGELLADRDPSKFALYRRRAVNATAPTSAEYPYLLVRDGTFEWGSDPLVSFSPTLSRQYRSERKLFPNGFVEMLETDAALLELSGARRAMLTSVHGNAVVPVVAKADLQPGVLSVPYIFRDRVSNVLSNRSVVAVKVERA